MKLLLKLMMLTMITFVMINLQSCQQESLTDEILDNATVQYYHYKERVYTIETTGTSQEPEMVESQDSRDLIQLLQEKQLNVKISENDPSAFYLYDEPTVTLEESGKIEERGGCVFLRGINTLASGTTSNCFDRGESLVAELRVYPIFYGDYNRDVTITLERYAPYYQKTTLYNGNISDLESVWQNPDRFRLSFSANTGLYRIKARNTCTQVVSSSYVISVGGYLNEAFCI